MQRALKIQRQNKGEQAADRKPEWWEVDQSSRAITELDLEKNEYLDPALSPDAIAPFTPQAQD